MICKKCGAQLPDDAQKCEFCGEVFVDEPTQKFDIDEKQENDIPESRRSTHEIFEENAKKRKEQVNKAKNEKQQQLDEISERREIKRLRKRRNKIILICVLCAVVAAGAVAGTYYVKYHPADKDGDSMVISTQNPGVTPIPTIAPIATPDPSATQTPEATQGTENNWTPTNNENSSNTSKNTSQSNSSSQGGSTHNNSQSGGSNSSSGTKNSSGSGSSSGAANAAPSQPGKPSGAVSTPLKGVLATGNEVVKDSNGKSYMTFTAGNVRYYANVSPDSTTGQIQNKPMTLTATPTNEKYNGNTVYEITSLTYYDGTDYILPNSGTKALTKSELEGMSKEKLAIARNEIYARHGRKFQMDEYQRYFDSKSWYKPNPNYDYKDDNNNLNDIEKKNVDLILSAEKSK